ncbi:DMT family transporter [Leeia oryzae]|uniref:DMT family transporter n=1 Tax=Leeia oryzae TaxID=356662 RepID=UPI00037196F8|nr:DMT family transporter [Leeia oryzae]
MLVTLGIWTGFALSIRAIGKSPLAPADVALLRFGIPGLLLLPLLKQRWAEIRKVPARYMLMILAGGGLPFFFAAAWGGAATSTAYVGALVAGTAPLFVTLFGVLLFRQTVTRHRVLGLLFILGGIAALLWQQLTHLQSHVLSGALYLLGASALWGIYTLGIRKSGLDALSCNLLLCTPSFLMICLLLLSGAVPTHLGHFSLHSALPFILLQGVGVGLIAGFSYGFSISKLGAEKSALIGSLTPALATLCAIPLMGEPVTATIMAGILLITAGVAVANLTFSRKGAQHA